LDNKVFAAVLFAAFLHAAWNAIVKDRDDRFRAIAGLGLAQGVLFALFIPFVPALSEASWAWVIASAAAHTGYKLFLVRAYMSGDLGQVYPLARGAAPMLSAISAFFLFGEALPPFVWAGVAVLCAGIAMMSLKGGAGALNTRAVFYALATSVFIALYTIVDATGARGASSVTGYMAWLFLIDGAAITLIYALRRGPQRIRDLVADAPRGLMTAAISLSAYWIVVWAMTRAPVGAVAALRESSILFALLIATLFLKERASPWRYAAGGVILAGVVLMRLG
jgi:drug/metabolite transporter (DMT)-like permease